MPSCVIIMDKPVAPFSSVIFVFVTGMANRSVTVAIIVVAKISFAAAVTGKCPVVVTVLTDHAVLDLVIIFIVNNAAAAAANNFTHSNSPLYAERPPEALLPPTVNFHADLVFVLFRLLIALVNSSGVISSMLCTPYLASTVSSITPVLFNSVFSSLKLLFG